MPLPSNQTCIFITAAGGPDVLQARPAAIPAPGDDEVLIQVRAAGVNRHDCNQRSRGPTGAHSDVPGLEVAGIVEAIGTKVGNLSVGDRVCALTDGGGYAEYALAKAGQVLLLPATLDFVGGAAVPEAAFTVWHNFFRVARLGPGESVLLHGGTSGVGVLAIQILRALGHPVFATCGSAEKMNAATALGAKAAFNYREDSFVDGIRLATGNRGVDVILDMSGGRHSERNLQVLARRGRLVHLSGGGGAELRVPLAAIMAKEIHVTGSLLRPLPSAEKDIVAAELHRVVWPLLSSGAVHPVIHRVLPLTAASDAHRLMEEGDHIGKIILEPERS